VYALHRSAASFAWFRGARQAIDIDPFGAGALEQARKGFGGRAGGQHAIISKRTMELKIKKKGERV